MITFRSIPTLYILLASVALVAVAAGAALLAVLSEDPWSKIEVVDLRQSDEVEVILTDEGFVPRYVRVKAGTRVTFKTERDRQFWPASNPHPSHTIYNAFDPRRPLESDEVWSFVPQRTGVWGYHDHIRSYYIGTLYVE